MDDAPRNDCWNERAFPLYKKPCGWMRHSRPSSAKSDIDCSRMKYAICLSGMAAERFCFFRNCTAASFSLDMNGGFPTTTLKWRSEEHTSELQSLRHLVCR